MFWNSSRESNHRMKFGIQHDKINFNSERYEQQPKNRNQNRFNSYYSESLPELL